MSTDNVRGQGHYQPTYQKARGVNLFYSPPDKTARKHSKKAATALMAKLRD